MESYALGTFKYLTEGCKFSAIDSLAGDTGSEITDKFRESLKQLNFSDTQGLPYETVL